jgi:hypothetical protein
MGTRRDTLQQVATPLSSSQETALQALLAGESVTAAAKTAKVNRSTLHRWLNDPDFLATLNLARHETRTNQEHRLAILANGAVEAVEQAIEQGDLRAALAVLRGVGLLSGQPAPIGPADPAQIRVDQSRRERSHELDLLLAEI